MPITVEHQKEFLSVAYVYAVAAQAGLNISHHVFDYGIDVTISRVKTLPSGKRIPTGYDFHFQLKATDDSLLRGSSVVYELKAEAYNKFRLWEGSSPYHLILLRLPKDRDLWLSCNEDVLTLRHCCYWHLIEPGATIENTSSKTIYIPRQNQFTVDALNTLVGLVTKG